MSPHFNFHTLSRLVLCSLPVSFALTIPPVASLQIREASSSHCVVGARPGNGGVLGCVSEAVNDVQARQVSSTSSCRVVAKTDGSRALACIEYGADSHLDPEVREVARRHNGKILKAGVNIHKEHGGRRQKGKEEKHRDRKGKDRKGKEHKGNEHKGKEHKGKDDKGKDHKGKDHKDKDRKGKDHIGKDHEGKDHKGRHQNHKEHKDKNEKEHQNKHDHKGKEHTHQRL